MKVWLMRHGESETNLAGQWTGWYDAALTEKGKADAARAGAFLAGKHFDKIYTSDLCRARCTAEIAIPGCRYEETPLVREIYVGSLAGKPLSAVYDESGQPMNKDGYGRFGGETITEFRERVRRFMELLAEQKQDNIAVFAHNGFLRTFLDLAMGTALPRKYMLCRNCAVAIFEYENATWKLHSWINLD